MSSKSDGQSPAQLARANRLRLAAEEGARVMEDVVKEAIAVRKNMARLKELRLAKEAAAMHEQAVAGNDEKAKPRKRRRR
jgi:hypothetical protein